MNKYETDLCPERQSCIHKKIGTMEILEQQYLVCEDGRVQESIRNSRKSFAAFR